MTNRILTSLKTFAVTAALRVVPTRAPRLAEARVQPRVRPLELNEVRKPEDAWMFESADTPVSAEAHLLSTQMNRAGGALSDLRSLLTQISAHAPLSEFARDEAPFGPMATDDVLFEGEAMAIAAGAPIEDADLFCEDAVPHAQAEEYARVA